MKHDEVKTQVAIAVRACMEKKAEDISILRLDAQASGFTDYFVICSAANPRQVQAIGDEVDEKLSKLGYEPSHLEGRKQAEWLLLDYVDFVVHIFSESARKFYDLERLWKTATRVELAALERPEPKKAAPKGATKRSARTSGTASSRRGRNPNLLAANVGDKGGAPRKKSGARSGHSPTLSPKTSHKGGAPVPKRTRKGK